MDPTEVTVALGAIIVLGVGGQWLGRKTGFPSIVILLVSGILVGPVAGIVEPDELFGDLLDPAVTLAVGLLLFDSGFAIRFARLTGGRSVIYRLVSLGLLVTWVVGAVGAVLIFDLSPDVAALLGAILVVSGPTVVGPILRASRPQEPTGTILEWEGTLLDPIGAALAVAVFTFITNQALPLAGTAVLVVVTALTGIVIGAAIAALLILALRYYAIPGDLEVPVAFTLAVLAFSLANVLFSEAGLFATLTMGLVLANQRRAYVARIRRFEASVGTLVIGTLFVVLAATIDLDALIAVVAPSAALLGMLVLVARPLAALVSTTGSSLTWPERGFVASLAPRGIVAASTVSFFAISLKSEGIDADEIVPITFAIIVGAGIVYGFGSPLMARLLGVGRGKPKGLAFFMTLNSIQPVVEELTDAGVPIIVIDDDVGHARGSDVDYTLFADGVQAEGLGRALSEANVGSAVIGTGLGERDLVAMQVAADELGGENVHFVPRMTKGAETGADARWRERTPDRLVAFGPDITRDRLRDLIRDDGVLEWFPAGVARSELPDGTVPLFIVTPDGRGQVANQRSMRHSRHRRNPRGSRLLCVYPRSTVTTRSS